MNAFLDVVINKQSLRSIIVDPPRINDQLEAICRTMDFKVRNCDQIDNFLGQPVELWYNRARWFIGILTRRGATSDGFITYMAYDPLFFLKKHPDDYYFKNKAGGQIFAELASRCGVRVKSITPTGAPFKGLYYQGQDADKIAVDIIARIYKASGRKFWFRYDPTEGAEGLVLFERNVPDKIWAFQAGINLTSASKEEDIEDLITTVKLVNRETGKTVIKQDADASLKYGHRVLFEEVDKEHASQMEKTATEKLKKLSQITTRLSFSGVNPAAKMPQFFGADVVYVEEPYTRLIGAYYIESVTQTFAADSHIDLDMEIRSAPEMPEVEYDDATKAPDPQGHRGHRKKKNSDTGTGVQQHYSKEVQATMQKYGVE